MPAGHGCAWRPFAVTETCHSVDRTHIFGVVLCRCACPPADQTHHEKFPPYLQDERRRRCVGSARDSEPVQAAFRVARQRSVASATHAECAHPAARIMAVSAATMHGCNKTVERTGLRQRPCARPRSAHRRRQLSPTRATCIIPSGYIATTYRAIALRCGACACMRSADRPRPLAVHVAAPADPTRASAVCSARRRWRRHRPRARAGSGTHWNPRRWSRWNRQPGA
eukprot:COSAG03_NODE_3862_length_1788_cov_2.089402_2_plen_226_part_00